MPAKNSDEVDYLAAFTFHGMDLSPSSSGNMVAECPFCGASKWFVAETTGLWECKVCGEKGNPVSFLQKLHEVAETVPPDDDLTESRGIASWALNDWGVRVSPITGEFIVAGYSTSGKVSNLYRYIKDKTGRMVLIATRGMSHGIHGVPPLVSPASRTVYLCEGPWDGMRLYEVLSTHKLSDSGKVVPTSNQDASMLKGCSILAVPGCNVFDTKWASLLSGKDVVILYDSDHPRKHPKTGQLLEATGWAAARRVTNTLASSEQRPASISVLKWGEAGYDPSLKTGTDIRDVLKDPDTGLTYLDRVIPIPDDWIAGRSLSSRKNGGTDLGAKKCTDWRTLTTACKKAMKWTEGLDRAMSVMLAAVASTQLSGDQLWVKIVGPPSTGKSTLCEALAANTEHVYANSTMRGFHSGFRDGPGDTEDKSLAARVNGKTLVTKDGDTLLQSPNLSQILSEGRDLYDRVSRTEYRNGIRREHLNHSMTWILCGTRSIRGIDASELGERFVDCVIMDAIDDGLEDDILDRQFNKARRATTIQVTSNSDTSRAPETTEMMRLTAGYIDYLRDAAGRLADSIDWSDAAEVKVKALAKFISYMRARPGEKPDEPADRELASRLLSQLVRLAIMLAIVLNRKSVDGDVMRRVRRVALDTARGHSYDIVKILYDRDNEGMDPQPLSLLTKMMAESCRKRLRFLSQIGAVEMFSPEGAAASGGIKYSRVRWRLTEKMVRLYSEVSTDE